MRKFGIQAATLLAVVAIAGNVSAKDRGDKDTTTLDVGTVSTSTSDITAQKNWNAGLVFENYIQARGPNTGNYGPFQSQINANATYSLSATDSVQIRQYGHYNMTDGRTKNEWGIGDTAFQYNKKAVQIGQAPVDTQARLYIPVEQYNAAVGKYELRLQAVATQAISKSLNLSYIAQVRAYAYTKEQQGQRSFRAMPQITLSYAPAGLFQPYISVYEDSDWRFNSGKEGGLALTDNGFINDTGAGSRKNYAVNNDAGNLDVGSKINISKTVSLDLYYEATADWHNPSSDAWDNGSYQAALALGI